MTFVEVTNKLTQLQQIQRKRLRQVALTRAKATHARNDAVCVQCGVKLQANYKWIPPNQEKPPVAERELDYQLRGVLGSGAFHSKECAVLWAIETAELASAELHLRNELKVLCSMD